MIIDIKKILNKKEEELGKRLENLKQKGIIPKIVCIIANSDESSMIYINNKKKMCNKFGILQEEIYFKNNCTNEEIIECIKRLNKDDLVTAILVQLPLYKHLDTNKIIDSIDERKDVDGFCSVNLGKLVIGKECIIPCTPKGIMYLIDEFNVDLNGKNAVVIGRSNIVGKPIAQLLLNRNCTVTICHSKTENICKYTKEADILVVSTGNARMITEGMIKKGSVVIDVGINRVNGEIIGDVDTVNVAKKASIVTPVPGGVGKLTVLFLIENIIQIAEKIIKSTSYDLT